VGRKRGVVQGPMDNRQAFIRNKKNEVIALVGEPILVPNFTDRKEKRDYQG